MTENLRYVTAVELLSSQKLMLEYEKYNELQAKSQRMQEDYENQLRELEKSKQGGLEELTEYYEAKLQETCARLEQVADLCLLISKFGALELQVSTLLEGDAVCKKLAPAIPKVLHRKTPSSSSSSFFLFLFLLFLFLSYPT